jgi:uncharacterized protein
MKRFVDKYLLKWKNNEPRMPLLIRGARQVGKTHAVVHLGKTFEDFIEINFEQRPQFQAIFEKDLEPERIVRELTVHFRRPITPGRTLLFFDEIQASENAFKSLRYFYELMPSLHVIAAGSLLDFQIENIGMPVGRIEWLYMYPMSFIEFLYALGYELLAQEILNHNPPEPMSDSLHNLALSLLGEYFAVGGMPAVVKCWRNIKDIVKCGRLLRSVKSTYRNDFNKYARRSQLKYLDLLFTSIPRHLGEKFKYSAISQDYTKRELAPCLELLSRAGVVTKVLESSGQGIPLGSQARHDHFKVIFLDIALSQNVMALNIGTWLIDPLKQFVNKRSIVEAFVGQEILAYSSPFAERDLYYWHREGRTSNAEVDYLIQKEESVIPIEVKSGHAGTLQSMKLFLSTHPDAPYGIRCAPQNYTLHENVYTYPLYAIARLLKDTPY